MDKEMTEIDFEAMEAQEEEWRQQEQKKLMRRKMPAERDLNSALLNMTRKEMDDIRYNLCVTGASTLKKEPLAKLLTEKITSFTQNWLPSVTEEQYQLFQRFIKADGLLRDDELNLTPLQTDYLRGLGFIAAGTLEDKLCWYMPTEILASVKKAAGTKLKKRASLNTKVLQCATGLLYYYGVLDYTQLHRLAAKYFAATEQLSFFDFMGVVINGASWTEGLATDDQFAYYPLAFEPEKLAEAQLADSKHTYAELPAESVFAAGSGALDYLEPTPAYEALSAYLQQEQGLGADEAKAVLLETYIDVQTCVDYDKIVAGFSARCPKKIKKDKANQLIGLWVTGMRLWVLKGHSSQEASEQQTDSRIVPFFGKRAKVGRNEPCPCGSGKKYKKCCMEKDLAGE